MRQVADGVLEVHTGFVNSHIVAADDGVVLVDTRPAGHRFRRLASDRRA